MKGLNLGTLGGVDVLADEFAIECKSRVKFVGVGWMEQALKYAKKHKKTPLVVVHKKNSQYINDLVMLRMRDFLKLLERIGHDQ